MSHAKVGALRPQALAGIMEAERLNLMAPHLPICAPAQTRRGVFLLRFQGESAERSHRHAGCRIQHHVGNPGSEITEQLPSTHCARFAASAVQSSTQTTAAVGHSSHIFTGVHADDHARMSWQKSVCSIHWPAALHMSNCPTSPTVNRVQTRRQNLAKEFRPVFSTPMISVSDIRHQSERC